MPDKENFNAVITYRKQGHPQNSEQGQGWEETNVNDTLNIYDNGEVRTPTLIIENHPNDSCEKIHEDDAVQTLSGRMETGGGNEPMCMENSINAIVRRLTPVECERLQAYPDGWTDIGEWTDTKGKVHKESSDSSRYKALGNSIALPFWEWMAKRMIEVLKKDGVESPTMAGLFSGIGGFEFVYSRCGCEPVWSSEIDEFPIAVMKRHFGDDDTGEKGDVDKYVNQVLEEKPNFS